MLTMLLTFCVQLQSQTNRVPDISYINDFAIRIIDGEDCACYPWYTAKRIGIDLIDLTNKATQLNRCKSIVRTSTNVMAIDNKIFEQYEKRIRKANGRGVVISVISLGAGLLLGIILAK